ncbi:hypothetical protein EDB81DRAFT_887771 [Dactylonectria macrodidyma]|uniref:Uncharacterized protein n=1 Tax=Dactylonectria macrodidyma TaxID=307937 RepID=A0A9P9E8U1_9HYPO|nr:hypothetical protein EDB81DRAFT_887771 [Dactylonectria macrodidyma]
MSAPSSPAEARSLVDKISEDHGWIPDDSFNEMSERANLVACRAMKTKDAKIALAVTTLAKNLYTSSSRFVFELPQNADDSAYMEAQKGGQDPFLSFRVSPTQIVLECNEDGFTNEKLMAICDIGRSSKKGAQGFIAEKGIGFKSVFMAAWKVEIRSGHLSFCFQHRH